MRLLGLSHVNKKSSVQDAPDVFQDIHDLVELVLPRCTDRPFVYNRLAKLVRRLEADAEIQARTEAEWSGVPYEHKKSSNGYMLFLPDSGPDTSQERAKDVSLLEKLLELKSLQKNKSVLSRLETFRKRIAMEVNQLEKSQRESAVHLACQMRVDTEVYLAVLPLVHDRPKVHNFVISELQKLHQHNTFRLQNGSAHWLQIAKQNVFLFHSSPWNRKVSISRFQWKVEPKATALERWLDVMRLDDVLDRRPLAISNARRSLEQLKALCKAEARKLQRQELTQGHGRLETPPVEMFQTMVI